MTVRVVVIAALTMVTASLLLPQPAQAGEVAWSGPATAARGIDPTAAVTYIELLRPRWIDCCRP
jgi:hypothetical protein